MPTYDPQRKHPRAAPSGDEPAPVDALLDATASHPVAGDDASSVVAAPAPPNATAPSATSVQGDADRLDAPHLHGPDCHHDHDHGYGVNPLATAGAVLSAVLAVLLLRQWRRRRHR